MDERRGVREGMPVEGSDGVALGEVSVCGESHFLVAEKETRFLRPDRVARYDQVAGVESGRIRLVIPASEVPYGMDYRGDEPAIGT